MEDLICETHHLRGSLNDDRENLIESMKNFVDTNALVTRCWLKDSVEELKENPFWKNSQNFKKEWSR